VIVADTFTSLSAQYLGPDAWLSQRPVVVLTAGTLAMLMCFPRNLSALGANHPRQQQRQLMGHALIIILLGHSINAIDHAHDVMTAEWQFHARGSLCGMHITLLL
jgi:hypothetical protein